MRNNPVIPKLEGYGWDYHCAEDEDGNGDGSIFSTGGTPYCIAKQPRYASKEKWETHAKCLSKVPDMLRYLIELHYQANRDGKISKETMKEVTELLRDMGCYDEDIW